MGSPATRARSNAGRLALVHAAGDLADAVAAVEGDDGAPGGRPGRPACRARRTAASPTPAWRSRLSSSHGKRAGDTSCGVSGLPQPWPMSATAGRPCPTPPGRRQTSRKIGCHSADVGLVPGAASTPQLCVFDGRCSV